MMLSLRTNRLTLFSYRITVA